MRSFSDYTEAGVTEVFDKHGAFFAFGTNQFNEKRVEGVDYCTVFGACDCVPKSNAKQFVLDYKEKIAAAREKYLSENKIEDIIKYELANHECYYTGDWMEAFYVCEEFGATKEMVRDIYVKELPKNNKW